MPNLNGIQYLFTVPACTCVGAVLGLILVLCGASGGVAAGLIVASAAVGVWWGGRM